MKVTIYALAFLLLSSAAQAGDVSILNNKGIWQPTACKKPIAPAFVGLDKTTSAKTMNVATERYNQFVKQTQDYVACLSDEARKDNEASNTVINATLDKRVQEAEAEVARTRVQLLGPVRK